MKCGIYKITNKLNGKIYIGQSVDIKKRWREHIFSSLHLENKDHNSPIHLALAKYGKDNFNFEIIEICDKNKLNEKEIYWIDYYKSYKNGYNATIGGDEDHRHLGTPIEVYDLEGNYIITYDNATITAEKIGVHRGCIYQILDGKRLSAKGFQFKRVNDDKIITKYKSRQGGTIKILQKDLNNNVIKEWDSAAQIKRELGFDSSSITKCCKHKLKTYKGYRWYYANEV